MFYLFTFKSGSVQNTRPSTFPELGLFSLSSFRAEGVTITIKIGWIIPINCYACSYQSMCVTARRRLREGLLNPNF